MGFLTTLEYLNQVLWYVKENLADFYLDLPIEMIDILIDYEIYSDKIDDFSTRKWMKFLHVYLLNIDLNWDKFNDDMKEEFRVRYLENQKFVVKEQYKTFLEEIFRAPYSGGYDVILEPGTILMSKHVTYFVNESICLIPLEYKEFEDKYIPREDIESPFYNGFAFSVSINDLSKYFLTVLS
jgi:hypothetical protein